MLFSLNLKSLENASTIEVIHFAVPTIIGMTWLLVLCSSGDYLTQRFDSVSNAIYLLDWYTFPTDIQKDLLILLTLAQNSIYLEGYADIQCTNEIFKKVLMESRTLQ